MAHGDLPPDSPRRRGTGSKREVMRLRVEGTDLSSHLEPMPSEAPPAKVLPNQPRRPIDEPEESAIDLGNPEEQWEEERERRKPAPVGWIGLIGIGILVTGIWALGKMAIGERRIEKESQAASALVEAEEKDTEDAKKLLAEVERAVAEYIAAETVEQKSLFVRHPGRVRPLMEAYYRNRPLESQRLHNIDYLRPVTIGKFPFIYLRVNLKDRRNVPFVIEQTTGNGLKFDWESEVGYQPLPVDQYIAEKPVEPMDFRVYVAKDNHYVHEFADQERYLSLFLSFRGTDEFLFAYIERGTPDERRLGEYLGENQTKALPALLRLSFPEGASARRSVLVEKFLAPQWAYLESPAGE